MTITGTITPSVSLEGEIRSTAEMQGEITSAVSIGGEVIAKRGLKGEKGDKGDTGEKGDKGDKGDPGTTDHTQLLNRNASNQHPESAITGLEADLLARPSTVITDEEIMAL